MIIIGLTGSIGMGKTTAADMFRRLGAPVHDSDLEVHRLLAAGGAAAEAVATLFPSARSEDGGIDRKKLGMIVFTDPEKRKKLEAIVHPLVRQAQDRFLDKARAQGAEVAVLDIPLLFETGAEARVDLTVCVTAPAFIQKQRVLGRPGMTPEKFASILSGQMPDREKRQRADFIVQTGLGRAWALQKIKSILAQAKKMKK